MEFCDVPNKIKSNPVIHNKLQPRILKKGEVKPLDYHEFVQCYECGKVFPVYEAHYESEIKD